LAYIERDQGRSRGRQITQESLKEIKFTIPSW